MDNTQEENRDTSIARHFHEATSYRAALDHHGEPTFMMGTPPDLEHPIWEEDWSVEPFPYKVYETLAPIPLPHDFPPTTIPALDALASTGTGPEGDRIPDLATLARISLLSNGILKRGSHRPGGGVIEYRAAGGTGARYHLELYFACGDLPDLDAGVYHFSAQDHSLRRLRTGDVRAELVAATGQEQSIAAAPVFLAMTSTFWRNAWRYKGRAYRHAYWDAGTTFANILALAASDRMPTQMVFGFADAAVNNLLGVDGTREATLALCAIGRASSAPPPAPEVTQLHHPTRPISAYEVDFPVIGMMHEASTLATGDDAAAWRSRPLHRVPPEPHGDLIPLRPIAPGDLPPIPVEDLIRKRRSTRNYDTGAAIGFDAFSTLVDRASRGFAADCLASGALPLHDQYLIVNRVEGLEPGVYRVHPDRQAIELVRPGTFRAEAQRLAVDQAYAGDAHVNSYYLADLDPVLAHYGNRGYRVAQLEAALYGSRLHLATHALGLGAVGSTSLDGEVVEFFTPGKADASYLFVVVFGKRRRRTPASG
jgi:SagB-type dehydrogenase family enzyme